MTTQTREVAILAIGAGLALVGLVAYPLVWLYARTRKRPKSWTQEQRERSRLSATLGAGGCYTMENEDEDRRAA